VATSLVTTGNYEIWARARISRLTATLPTGRIEAPLVHAHIGHYAGVVATALARDDARTAVTEHVTFLPKVFKQPGFVAINPARQRTHRRYIDTARERGYGVDLIALDPAEWTDHQLDDGVRIHGIGTVEDRRLTRRFERAVRVTFLRWTLGFARARASQSPATLPAQTPHAGRAGRASRLAPNRHYLVR
jgi:hypothetical protein